MPSRTGERVAAPDPERRARQTDGVIRRAVYERWLRGRDPELQAKLLAFERRVASHGATLGRPHVDTLHGTSVHRLKEGRINATTRVLFAFDSRRAPVMLAGGDKAGQEKRFYPAIIRVAEREYANHERGDRGGDGRWPGGRTEPEHVR
jgi:hypothetical protein